MSTEETEEETAAPEEDEPEEFDAPTQEQTETYERLVPMLEAAHREMSELSKKKQDGVLNPLKIRIINRLLVELRKLLEKDPSVAFVEMLDEETVPQNSDAVLLLSQWKAALMQYKQSHSKGGMGTRQWITVESLIEEQPQDYEDDDFEE